MNVRRPDHLNDVDCPDSVVAGRAQYFYIGKRFRALIPITARSALCDSHLLACGAPGVTAEL